MQKLAQASYLIKANGDITQANLWSDKNPNLYNVVTELLIDNTVVNSRITATGFRKVEFKGDIGTGGEVVDAQGRRCPTDEGRIDFSMSGPGIWRGGYNSGIVNSINKTYLNTECGINRVFIRSTLEAGTITLTASRNGLISDTVEVNSKPIDIKDGIILHESPDTTPPINLVIQENEIGFCGVDGTIDSHNTGFTGTGFANTSNALSTTVDWQIHIATSGNYTLNWRYANGTSTNRVAYLLVDGTTTQSLNFNPTGSWTNWSHSDVTVRLSEGTHALSLERRPV